MPVLLIVLCTVTSTVQSVFKKQYHLRYSGGNYFFSALVSFFALLFFILTAESIAIRTEIIPYCVIFACAYALCTVASLSALERGSLAITSLVVSYSLIIPTLYGLLFLHEPVGIFKCVGIAFLLVSLFLIRADSKKEVHTKKNSAKWLVCVILAFFSNGICSVTQNAQQRSFSGAENSNFMILSLCISVGLLLVLSVLFERRHILPVLKKAVCGQLPAASATVPPIFW